jgi:hypothetical protein
MDARVPENGRGDWFSGDLQGLGRPLADARGSVRTLRRNPQT